jgi:predicted HTH domain antitoxin
MMKNKMKFQFEEQLMVETTFEVRIPTPLLRFGIDQSEIQRRVNEWLVLSLFTEGHISSGKAARLLNINRVEFLALLRARGISFVNYTPDELADEFAAVDALDINWSFAQGQASRIVTSHSA